MPRHRQFRFGRPAFRVLAIAALTACGGEDAPTDVSDSVVSVTVTPANPVLTALGASLTLTASATRASGAAVTGASFTWTSSNTSVATVDAGVVTATGPGATTVSARLEGISGGTTVTVTPLATSVSVSPATDTLVAPGETLQLELEVRDANDSIVTSPAGTWASSDPGVATVSADGLVTAVADGTTFVSYTLDSAADSAEITVDIPTPGPAAWEVVETSFAYQRGTWGSGPNDYWSVGGSGSILHFDGTSWQNRTPGLTTVQLEDVWGAAADDVWAVGASGTVLHYDGAAWSDASGATSENLRSLWGASASDVWAVGGTALNTALILHYDGSDWSTQSPGTGYQLIDVSGTAPDDVFAVGANGAIVHYDGTDWTSMSSGTTQPLWAVWASAPDDVWVAAGTSFSRSFLHYDGTSWTTSPPTSPVFNDIWGAAADDVWTVAPGFNFAPGKIMRFDGGSWSDVTPPGTVIDRFSAVWGTSPSNVVVTGQGGMGGGMASYSWDGTSWTDRSPGVIGPSLTAVWGITPHDVWAVSSRHGIVHFDGSGWTDETVQHNAGSSLYGVWASASDDVWAVGSGAPSGSFANQILRYDGFTWSDADPHLRAVATYRGIWGSAANDIWAVGNSAEIIHYDGFTWSSAATLITGAVLGHVWGAAADSVWAVGEDSGSPLILYWDGTQWIDQSPAVSGWFAGVWGTSATNVWAVGGSGTPMWHYDGTDWTAVASISPSASLRAVFGSGPTDVWAVGNEVVYHYDGTDWTDVSPVFAPAVSLSGVWMPAGDPAGDIWAVGGAGTILRGTR